MKITGLFYLYFLLVIVNFSHALRCGKKFNNKKCPENQCCNYLGYCGRNKKYCDISYGCQSEFGRCIESDSSSSSTTTTTTITASKTIPTPVFNCNACCSESGQCSFDLESCGAGCQSGYGFCLPDEEYLKKDNCLNCENCLNCDDSPIDKLLCPNTCFKDGNKKNETIEIKPCTEEDIRASNGETIDPEQLCYGCNKYFDCTLLPEITYDHPNACKRASNIISTDGTCGPQNDNKVCPDNQCCDKTGHCSITEDSCGKGCQYGYGNCLPKEKIMLFM